ncbi:6-carboxytetrahydropterin synthase QueD [Salinicoccus hispanicus]|uniref:6-carboxy-5,6,7,8-tetrahydropterin synthase n=1 Tax=Salinicoccus hispanicus TaxID=157225 RepID=A0A6N8TY12_9STAP|nr:6-carboxytetrahydropterin synthase QueD [Salinicoccus hispanicus]MXQ50640.1 6-carboxytetrahydropterin synthase QueD [Salinicoccus hispanicus]
MYQTPAHDYQYELNKDLNFSAAHYVPDERAGKCSRVHGHTYFVNITLAGDQLDDLGFLVNFSSLKSLISDAFDHTLLNEHERFKERPPTSETLAETIYDMVETFIAGLDNRPVCLQIYLQETPTSYVIYRPKESRK